MRTSLLAALTLVAGQCADVDTPRLGDSAALGESEPPADTGHSEVPDSEHSPPPEETGHSDPPDDTGPSPAHLYGLGNAHARILGASGSSSAGLGVSIAGDVNADGQDDLLVGTADGDGGTVYLLAGPLDGDLDTEHALASLAGDSVGQGAYRLCRAGDLDVDGHADIVVGAPGPSTDGGGVYLLHGPVQGDLSLADADAVLAGEQAGDEVGTSVAAGDMDGDSTPDLAVGAPGRGDEVGAVFLFLGPPSAHETMGDATVTLQGTGTDERAGACLACASDHDGDGLVDLLVGAPGKSSGGSRVGGAYLLLDAASGAGSLADADGAYLGEDAADLLGSSVAGLDLDGDGYDDVALGAPDNDRAGSGAGCVYVLSGAVAGTLPASDAATWILVGAESPDGAGSSLASAGDPDGDGRDGLLVGAPAYDSGRGQVYLVSSAATGTSSLAYAEIRFAGEDPGTYAGYQHGALGGGGDVSGDGVPDWVAGAFGLQGKLGQQGAAYLWSGADM